MEPVLLGLSSSFFSELDSVLITTFFITELADVDGCADMMTLLVPWMCIGMYCCPFSPLIAAMKKLIEFRIH